MKRIGIFLVMVIIMIASWTLYSTLNTVANSPTNPIGDCDLNLIINDADIDKVDEYIRNNHTDYPISCDANEDGVLTIADKICIPHRIKGQQCEPPNTTSTIGTNLAHITDHSSEFPFVNVFKNSRSWITQANGVWNTWEEETLDLDHKGWVRSLPQDGDSKQYRFVGTLLFTGLGTNYPAGQYTVLYDGEGTIDYHFDAIKNDALSSPGRDVIDVVPGSSENDIGIYMAIMETDPNRSGNYIRNIRVLLPGFDERHENDFNPEFLASLENFRSIRFMDWMHTNWSTQGVSYQVAEMQRAPVMHVPTDVVDLIDDKDAETGRTVRMQNPFVSLEWNKRPLSTDARYSTKDGAPLEVMLNLVNLLQTDPWFNMPHQATDDYMVAFASTVRDNLSQSQKVYVEYSNEVWNGGFGQSQWVQEQALNAWPNSDGNQYTKKNNWYGMRTAQMCDIWKSVFNSYGQADRVVCVMGGQSVNAWPTAEMLNCELWGEKPCSAHGIDAIAIAPYVGGQIGLPQNKDTLLAWTNEADGGLSKLFQQLNWGGLLPDTQDAGSSLNRAVTGMTDHAELANKLGLDLIAYEGGQHLAGVGNIADNEAIAELFMNANRDQRMGTLYDVYLSAWQNAGGGLFTHFQHTGPYTIWGSWGSREYMTQSSTPKYDALQRFMTNNHCVNCGNNLTASAELHIQPVTTSTNSGQLPLNFKSNGASVTGISFTLDYDANSIQFDLNDTNRDQIPDGIWINHAVDANIQANNGLLTIQLQSESPFTDGTLLTINYGSSGSGTIQFADSPATSCSDSFGQSINCPGNGKLTVTDASSAFSPVQTYYFPVIYTPPSGYP